MKIRFESDGDFPLGKMLSIPSIIIVTRSAFQDIKNFDSNLLRIDKKLYKNNDIYYIGYITMKDFDYVNIFIF